MSKPVEVYIFEYLYICGLSELTGSREIFHDYPTTFNKGHIFRFPAFISALILVFQNLLFWKEDCSNVRADAPSAHR